MTNRLNLLFVTFDQWRGDCLSALPGSPVRTPAIDALACDAMLFENHYSVAAPCGPARASLLTGLYLHNHRSVRNGVPLDARFRTVAQRAVDLGYRPTLFGFTDTTLDPRGRAVDDPCLRTASSMAPGFEDGLYMTGDSLPWLSWLKTRGYSVPATPRDIWRPARPRARVDAQPTVYSAEESESAFLTRSVLDFIAAQGERPWFAHVSYFRPHHPYIAPEPYNTLYRPVDVPPLVRASTREEEGAVHPWLAAQLRSQSAGSAPVQDKLPMSALDDFAVAQLRATYYGSIAECDTMVGRLVEGLKEFGVYDHTLIVVTSDHGDMLGDHWLWAAESWHEAAFRVPLIIRDPRDVAARARGGRVRAFTESVDLAPTMLDLLGGSSDDMDGRSLRPFLEGGRPPEWRSAAHWELDFRDTAGPGLQLEFGLASEEANLSAIKTETELYVAFAALPHLLFETGSEPAPPIDRSTDPALQEHRATALRELLRWRMTSGDRALARFWIGPDGVRPIAGLAPSIKAMNRVSTEART